MQFFCENHFQYISVLGPWLPKDRPVTVVDAGANIGLASILFSQLINFNGEVLAIEANPSTLEVLQLCLLSPVLSLSFAIYRIFLDSNCQSADTICNDAANK